MEYMGVIGFVFGIFGFLAYLNMSPLKRKVESLEEALSKMRALLTTRTASLFLKQRRLT